MLKRSQYACRFLLCLLLLPGSARALNDKAGSENYDTIVIGVAPFMSPLALVKRFAPLRVYLTELLGKRVVIETATLASDFLERSLKGRYDFILTSPTFALKAKESGKYKVLLVQKNKLMGRIVVLNESPIRKLSDLNGKLLGAPPKIGFLGQIVEPYLKKSAHPDKHSIKVIHFRNHIDSILALRDRGIDASFITGFMQQHFVDKGINVREIARTEEYPGLTFMSLISRQEKTSEKVKNALIELDQNKKGKWLLKDISLSPFRVMEPDELEQVREYIDVY